MRKLLIVLSVLAGLAAVALLTVPAEAIPSAQTTGACYPGNQFSYTAGPAFRAISQGFATFEEAELQLPNQTPMETADGKSIQWSLLERMTKPSGAYGTAQLGLIAGAMNVTVNWANGDKTTFVSDCMAEVQTNYVGGVRDIELEAEGTVRGYPSCGGGHLTCFPEEPEVDAVGIAATGGQDAVASIVVRQSLFGGGEDNARRDGGRVDKVTFSLELGSTCYEGATQAADTEFSFNTGETNGTIRTQAANAGAFGFPGGFSPGANSGASDCPGFN